MILLNDKLNSLVSGIKAKRAGRRRFAAAMAAASVLVSGSVFWTLHGIGSSLSTADMLFKTDIEEPDDDYFVPDHVAANGGQQHGTASVNDSGSTSPDSSESSQKPATSSQATSSGGSAESRPPDQSVSASQDPTEAPTGDTTNDPSRPQKALNRKVLTVNGNANLYTTADSPYIVESGDEVTLAVNLKRVSDQSDVDEPYFIELTEEQWKAGSENQNLIYGGEPWQYFKCDGKPIFTRANTWGNYKDNNVFEELDTNGRKFTMISDDVVQMTLRLKAKTPTSPTSAFMTFAWGGNQNESVNLKVVQPGRLEIKGPSDSAFSTNNTSNTRLLPLEGDQTIELQGYTQYFTQLTEAQYNALTSASVKATYIKEKNGSYIKTDAKFWSFDVEKNANDNLKDTLVTKGGVSYSVEGDFLKVSVTYTAKEIAKEADAKITFYDGANIDKWKHYNDVYVTVKPKTTGSSARKFYVKTNEGYRDINRVHEWLKELDWMTNIDGYVPNSKGQPYRLYPGETIILRTAADSGYFSCTNNEQSGGRILNSDNSSPWVWTETDDSGKTWQYKRYTALTATDESVQVVFNYNGIQDGSLYIEVIPESTAEIFDHADIEIADGGTYTITKVIQKADGTKEVIEEVYDSVISDVYSSKIYKAYSKDAAGNIESKTPLERVDEYAAEGKEGKYAEFGYDDYVNIGASGGTQYEFTSKCYHGRTEGYDPFGNVSHVHFSQADVELVVFDVQLTLKPSYTKTYSLDADGKRIGTPEIAPLSGADKIIDHVEFDMEKQSIIDAVNKCPNHSGLDFTVIGAANEVSILNPAKLDITAQKVFENGTLKGDQFAFEIVDTMKTLDDATDDQVIFTVGNMADGTIKFPTLEFYTAGDYQYIIREKVPLKQEGITYDQHEVVLKIKVTYDEASKSYKATTTFTGNRTFTNTLETYKLPDTGGAGADGYLITGTVILIAAAAAFVWNRRKEENGSSAPRE